MSPSTFYQRREMAHLLSRQMGKWGTLLGFSSHSEACSHTSQEEGADSRPQVSHSNFQWDRFINPAGKCLPEGGQHELPLLSLWPSN